MVWPWNFAALVAWRPATERLAISLAVAALATAGTAAAGILQASRDSMLREWPRDAIVKARTLCASGEVAREIVDRQRNAGFETLSVAEYCVTALTRAGRDGALHRVRLADGTTNTAVAFDGGFVGAYLKKEPLPADLPSMAAVMPIADRCLRLQEGNARLCTLVGKVLGSRAAHGAVVPRS